jgi:hypothetical protein
LREKIANFGGGYAENGEKRCDFAAAADESAAVLQRRRVEPDGADRGGGRRI